MSGLEPWVLQLFSAGALSIAKAIQCAYFRVVNSIITQFCSWMLYCEAKNGVSECVGNCPGFFGRRETDSQRGKCPSLTATWSIQVWFCDWVHRRFGVGKHEKQEIQSQRELLYYYNAANLPLIISIGDPRGRWLRPGLSLPMRQGSIQVPPLGCCLATWYEWRFLNWPGV